MLQITKEESSAPVIANPMLLRPFEVRRTTRETEDTFTLELASVQPPCEFGFLPGQFNMLYVFGVGEIPVSISGDPGNTRTLVHTIREVGTVTQAMRKLRTGEVVGVRGPYGRAWPLEWAAGCDVVLVAGGIGMAPLRPALYQIFAQRERYGKVVVICGARSLEYILYRESFEEWRKQNVEVHAMSGWRANIEAVASIIARTPYDPLNTIAMICGPELMMRFSTGELQKRGVPEGRIYLSLERSMKCGVGLCGRCQHGPHFICKDGPVFTFDQVKDWLGKWEV